MTEPRCELSELLVSQCDHCRNGLKTLNDESIPSNISLYEREAKYSGKCSCGKRFKKGEIIAWDTEMCWWRAKKCCSDLFD